MTQQTPIAIRLLTHFKFCLVLACSLIVESLVVHSFYVTLKNCVSQTWERF